MRLVLVEHLYSVPVGRCICQLEYVGSRRQYLAGNLNRTAEGEHRLLVKVIGSGALDHSAQ